MQLDAWLNSFVTCAIVYIVGYSLLVGVGEAVSRRAVQLRQMEPVERNLQRVSHSVAYIAATLAVIYPSFWPLALSLCTSVMPASFPDADEGLPLIAVCVVGVSVLRIYAGLRAFRFFNPGFHEATPLLRPRAVCKTALGLGGLVYLAHNRAAYIDAGTGWTLLYAALWLAGAWCAVTGPVRLYLLRPRRIDGGNIEPPEWNWN
jgi:hypothetical protein